jgi:uncharacterized protein YdeI (YjbR/CyaY-like superfamily)
VEIDKPRLRFFRSAGDLRKWLERNGGKEPCLWVGFHKLASKKGGITYPEALDEALCHGWIDGIRKKVDESSYAIRFTPRRPRSIWSNVNIARVNQLISERRMAPAGIAEFEKRAPERSGVYSFERESASLTPEMETTFRRNRSAWKFYSEQPRGYRRLSAWWVVSAKRDVTRTRRLAQLIEDSANSRRIRGLGKKPS